MSRVESTEVFDWNNANEAQAEVAMDHVLSMIVHEIRHVREGECNDPYVPDLVFSLYGRIGIITGLGQLAVLCRNMNECFPMKEALITVPLRDEGNSDLVLKVLRDLMTLHFHSPKMTDPPGVMPYTMPGYIDALLRSNPVVAADVWHSLTHVAANFDAPEAYWLYMMSTTGAGMN